jgi:hypothetical protein
MKNYFTNLFITLHYYYLMMDCNMFRSLWHHLQCVRKSSNTLVDDDPITVKIYYGLLFQYKL